MISHLITAIALTSVAAVVAALYLLPVLIAWARRVSGLAPIAVIDVFLGWTFVGWVIALVLALRPVYPPGPVVQVMQHVSPPPPPPGQLLHAGWAGPPGPPPGRPDSPPPLLLPGPSARPSPRIAHHSS